jgi:hypothetical protein
VIGGDGGQLLNTRWRGIDELELVALAEQLEQLAVDELLDLVSRSQAHGSADLRGDPPAVAADEPHDLRRVGRRRDKDSDATAGLDLHGNAAAPWADRYLDLPFGGQIEGSKRGSVSVWAGHRSFSR